MKSLSTAIYNQLVDLYGAGSVFKDSAMAATFPYQTFNVGAASLPMRNTGALNKNAIDQIPFTIHVWGKDDSIVADRCDEIRSYFLDNKLECARHECRRVTVTSLEVSQDPDPDEDGQPVWHGMVIFETWLTRDYWESSSTESSASSPSASSASASSASTSASSSTASASSVTASSASTVSATSASSASTSASASSVSASSRSTETASSLSTEGPGSSLSSDAAAASVQGSFYADPAVLITFTWAVVGAVGNGKTVSTSVNDSDDWTLQAMGDDYTVKYPSSYGIAGPTGTEIANWVNANVTQFSAVVDSGGDQSTEPNGPYVFAGGVD